MLRKLAILILAGSTVFIANGQQVRPASSDKIYHEIAQMRHLVNVLYVAAHPDDENTRLLAWLVNERNIRTAYLSLTRGDGGQNILGSEQGDALGYIRTHELMEARKLDGAEQFFSRAIDFGFSKSYQETFRHWDKDQLTGDAVWVMRKFRPDVVICRFPPDTLAGHGQHAASAIIAAEAFTAAGDRSKYPDQLIQYEAWQPKRIFWNTYKFGDRNTTSESQLKVSVGDYEPTMGMGTGELAGMSRSVHKSQGAGTPSVPGIQTEYFKLVDGEPVTKSLFDGIDITWGRVGRKDIGADLKAVLENFNYRHPDASIPALIAIRRKIETVRDAYWRRQKLDEINQVIIDCSGFMAEVYTKKPETTAGSKLPFTMHVIARSGAPVTLTGIMWGNSDTTLSKEIGTDSLYTFEKNIEIPAYAQVTQPYWLSQPHNGDLFALSNKALLGMPETPVELNTRVSLLISGIQFTLDIPLSFKKLDPVKGDVVEALRITPNASLSFTNGLVIANADGSVDLGVQIHSFKQLKKANLYINDISFNITSLHGIDMGSNTDTVIYLHVKPASLINTKGKEFFLIASLNEGDQVYNKTQQLIQYSHIPTLQYFTAPYTKVLRANWKCTAKRIGYVEGAGDLVPTVLRQLGLQVDVLKDAGGLRKYDAIITGIRAVNVEKRMSLWLPVLLKYAQNGGTLIMQYNTLQDMVTTQIGPYPITLSSQRVTEENAKVSFTDPKCRLLNYPNVITDADFDGWVQERGLYFPTKWDDRYTTVFSMNDAGEHPLTGGTLVAKYGKGNYIYTPLSFSRQLPAGNKGAIRLLMNMMSIGK